jgi:hypothetical protein
MEKSRLSFIEDEKHQELAKQKEPNQRKPLSHQFHE